MNNLGRLLTLTPNLLDQRRHMLGLGSSPGSANQKVRREAACKVLIEHRAHSCRQLESGKKIFVNAPSSNDVQGLIADFDLANGRESKPSAFRQFLLPGKVSRWIVQMVDAWRRTLSTSLLQQRQTLSVQKQPAVCAGSSWLLRREPRILYVPAPVAACGPVLHG